MASADCTDDIVTVEHVAGPSQSVSVTLQHRDWAILDVAPDRGRIVFAEGLKLSTATIRGQDVKLLAAGEVTSARWSPDGTAVAYTFVGARAECGSSFSVWIVSATGGDARKLSDCAAYPAWAPDSKRIAFLGNFDGQGTGAIARIDVDGNNRKDLAAWSSTSAPTIAWSPHGNRIAFTAGAGSGDVRIIDANGSGSAVKVRHATLPAWRPDGRRLAVVRIEHPYDRFALQLISPSGAVTQRLDRGKGLSLPTWSPDGRLAYVKAPFKARAAGEIYVARPGAAAQRVTTEPGNTLFARIFWSRDGKRMLFLRCRT